MSSELEHVAAAAEQQSVGDAIEARKQTEELAKARGKARVEFARRRFIEDFALPPPPGAKLKMYNAGSPHVNGWYRKLPSKSNKKRVYQKINTDPVYPPSADLFTKATIEYRGSHWAGDVRFRFNVRFRIEVSLCGVDLRLDFEVEAATALVMFDFDLTVEFDLEF
jgi:hypothetical protein